jgi:uncharacterized membrane protein YqiK
MPLIEIIAVAFGVVVVVLLLMTFRYIPNNRLGIVEKRFSVRGSVKNGFIALNGEAGYQPEVLRGGWHVLMPFQYRIHIAPLVTIPQGHIGYIFARDGLPLLPSQVLGANTTAKDFQDVRAFLNSGGQRGPQRRILREGTYAINLAQFAVITQDGVKYLPLNRDEIEIFRRMADVIAQRRGFQPVVIKDADDLVGIITVHDGPSLPQGELIAPTVGEDPANAETFHNNFQDAEKFLAAGGHRGRQLQVLVEGTYFINSLFATVEMIPKTIIEVGNVGVVVSYTGSITPDLSGEEYKHGELVAVGSRGVWSTALLPGKYAFNTYAGKVIVVPTTNIILKWIKNQVGSHRLDENLSEVSLITKDAFEPSLPLSVVLHIDYKKAPLVIQRFGDIKRLVEQTLDPMVAAYFKNVGQTRTLIQLIQERSAIQETSNKQMKERFAHYNLELEEVLIGTPASSAGDQKIEQILRQLRDRQVAEEQVGTYERMEKAAVKERELREAEARARVQQQLTESEVSIAVQANQGKAEYQRSLQQAAQIRALAEAEADKVKALGGGEAGRVRALGEAEAERSARIGIAQALAIEEQVRAYGGPRFQLTQQVMSRFAEAVERAGVDVVPRIMVGATTGKDGGPSGSNLFETLLAVLLAERTGDKVGDFVARDPDLEALRSKIRTSLIASAQGSSLSQGGIIEKRG